MSLSRNYKNDLARHNAKLAHDNKEYIKARQQKIEETEAEEVRRREIENQIGKSAAKRGGTKNRRTHSAQLSRARGRARARGRSRARV